MVRAVVFPRKTVLTFIFVIIAIAVSQLVCIYAGWAESPELYGVDLVLWALVYELLALVYMGIPGKVNWRKKLIGTIAIFVLGYISCWLWVPFLGIEAAWATPVINFTVWVLVWMMVFTWLGL